MPRLFPCLFACALAIGCAGEPARPRSVVLVLVDTLRADHVGAYGHGRATTPALDAWAAEGAVFERAWATSAWTLPSVGSLLSGRLPSRHAGGLRLPEGGDPPFSALGADVPMLAEALSGAGFATAGVANNPNLHPGFGLSRGFETWDYVFGNYARHPRASQIVHWGLRWLDARDAARPFLLLLHVMDPHLTYDPPPSVRGRFTSGYAGPLRLPLQGFGAANAGWTPPREADRGFVAGAYDEEILFVDAQLARLRAGLRERGLADETLVVVTSDHGEELFDHGGFEHGHTLFEELLHVPLFFWGPGVRPGRHAVPVSLVDVAPTLLDALGLPPLPQATGHSLWPLLRGGEAPAPRALVAEGTLYGPARSALQRWPWKLVVSEGEPPRLFDLSRDPDERRDLAAQEPERVAALSAELARALRDEARERGERRPAEIDEATRAQLEGLGYLE
jgi:arylsulfatase A-like enzyme